MKLILEGDERIVNAIVRENRVRVGRGLVKFSPADSIQTPEGVTEEDVKNMGEAITVRDARIAELEQENDTLKAALEEKSDANGAPKVPDTIGEGDIKSGEDSDTTQAPEDDSKDVTEEDTKKVEEVPDTKGKKNSKN